MANPSLAVCFLIFILYPASYCQDPSLKSTSPHRRHQSHHGHRHFHHHTMQTRTVMDEEEPDLSDKSNVKGYDSSNENQETEFAESGDGESVMIGGGDTPKDDAVLDGWGIPAAFPPKIAESVSLPKKGISEYQQDGTLGNYQASHKDLDIQDEDNDIQKHVGPEDADDQSIHLKHKHIDHKQFSKSASIFDSPNKTKPPPTTSAFKSMNVKGVELRNISLKSLVSLLPQTAKTVDGYRSEATKEEENQGFSKKPTSKKRANRPRWYFRHDKDHSVTVEKEGKSRQSGRHYARDAALEKSRSEVVARSGDYFPRHANLSEVSHSHYNNNANHMVLHVENKHTDQEKKGGKPKNRRQKGQPQVKECVGCTRTEASIAEARERYKKVLRAQLLDKLRLVPTLTESPLPPKLPDEVFPDTPQQDHPGYEDQYYAKPTQLLVFGRDMGKHRLRKPGTGSYKFEVRGKVKGEVATAELWVYKMPDTFDVHEQTLVITQLHYSKGRRLRERSLVARLDTHVQEGWVRFDVTRLVRSWLEREAPAYMQMLAIRCKTCFRTNYRAIFGVKSHFRPVIVIRERRHSVIDTPREKRSRCDPNSRCCKFDLTVRFHDLGIHEIFYPKRIRTGYCYGTCERPDLHYHNHTMIIQRLRYGSYEPIDDAMRERLSPCCVPVVLREASLMYYINEGRDTQVSVIPNLLVDKCGCA